MKLVYLAGAYRSKDGTHGILRNIQNAADVARELWKFGLAVICPHTNTALMDGPDISNDVWMSGCIEMLSRCDGIVMMPLWEHSQGAQDEHRAAQSKGMPVFYLPDDSAELKAWAK